MCINNNNNNILKMYWCVCVYTSSEDEYVMCDVCGMCG